jgi:hypothetical protein
LCLREVFLKSSVHDLDLEIVVNVDHDDVGNSSVSGVAGHTQMVTV